MSTKMSTYYFTNQTSFHYIPQVSRNFFNGDAIEIEMLNNNSSLSVISINDSELGTQFYTLNKMYITLTPNNFAANISLTPYQLILQGNLNDYNNNSSKQILIFIPIFNLKTNTINGTNKDDSKTQINNLFMNDIIQNMKSGETYNILNGIDFNNFIPERSGKYYEYLYQNINYSIIQFTESTIWTNLIVPPSVSRYTLTNKFSITPGQKYDIDVINNGKSLAERYESNDIYIDCQPTNNTGQPVNVYTSKNLDQLKMLQIDDLQVWAFRIVTIFVIILIIFFIIKMFQIQDPPSSVTQKLST